MNDPCHKKTMYRKRAQYVHRWIATFACKQSFTFLALGILSLIFLITGVAFPQLVGQGKIFIRFTNLRKDDAKVLIRVHVVPNSDKPFGWSGWRTYVGCESRLYPYFVLKRAD